MLPPILIVHSTSTNRITLNLRITAAWSFLHKLSWHTNTPTNQPIRSAQASKVSKLPHEKEGKSGVTTIMILPPYPKFRKLPSGALGPTSKLLFPYPRIGNPAVHQSQPNVWGGGKQTKPRLFLSSGFVTPQSTLDHLDRWVGPLGGVRVPTTSVRR